MPSLILSELILIHFKSSEMPDSRLAQPQIPIEAFGFKVNTTLVGDFIVMKFILSLVVQVNSYQ